MKANSIRFSPITVALFAVLTTSQRLAALQEVEVTLDQAPQAVKDTILREAGGGKITEIEQETRNR